MNEFLLESYKVRVIGSIKNGVLKYINFNIIKKKNYVKMISIFVLYWNIITLRALLRK